MRRLIPVVLFAAAVVLSVYFLMQHQKSEDEAVASEGEVITIETLPLSAASSAKAESESEVLSVPFIELSGEENLVATLSSDFNGDGYDDQIVAVKRSFSPYIILIVAIYNVQSKNYERLGEIGTDITQARTFSFSGTDLTGEHKNALVYQGYIDSGSTVLKAYFLSTRQNGALSLQEIANFEADGTIFIQKTDRFESYEMANAKGKSYPIWVYLSDPKKTGDQIQRQYDWNANAGRYTLVKELRVSGSRIEAEELERIMRGNADTFGDFLSGMWYKTAVEGEALRYLFFDYKNREIIFLEDETESVYSWVNSSLRPSGIYITSVNSDIGSLERRFDITLRASDSISLRLQDDVRMPISENTRWDGQYKKMKFLQELKKPARKKETDFIKQLEENPLWYTEDGRSVVFADGKYTVIGSDGADSGSYALVLSGGKNIVQFRSPSSFATFSGMYKLEAVDSAVFGEKDIKFSPVSMNLDGISDSEGKSVLLVFGKNEDEEDEEDEENLIMPELVLEEVTPEVQNPPPVVAVGTSPRHFSPDGDGKRDMLTVQLKAQSYSEIVSWKFSVNDPETRRPFWSVEGKASIPEKLTWNGRGDKGSLVQSATDYPYIFTVTDSAGMSAKYEGFIQVDVLVIREGNKMKLQVPSIIFRSNSADFKSAAEVEAGPEADKANKGLDEATIANNQRVLSRVAEILQKFRDYKVTIEGNANNLTGTKEEEAEVQQLSEERAKFVMEWLRRNGIAQSRLSALGNGSKNPATSNFEYRWQNRRVEFILQKPDYDDDE